MMTNRLPLRALGCAGALILLSGCISPENYESEPVEVATPLGTVTCQLYTRNMVYWDRAIDRPPTMSVSTADAICVQEGERIARG